MVCRHQNVQVWAWVLDSVVAGVRADGALVHHLINMGQSMNTKNTELANLLGQQDAIVQAAQFKGCPIIVKQRPKS
jgi:hypothetical protein